MNISKIFSVLTTTTTETKTMQTFANINVFKPTFETDLNEIDNSIVMGSNSYRMELMENLREQLKASENKNKTQNLNCKNGGFLIDGLCLCLKNFSGIECEIAPKIVTNTIKPLEKKTTTTTITDNLELIKAKKLNLFNQNKNFDVRRQRINDKDFTLITINRHGSQGIKTIIYIFLDFLS